MDVVMRARLAGWISLVIIAAGAAAFLFQVVRPGDRTLVDLVVVLAGPGIVAGMVSWRTFQSVPRYRRRHARIAALPLPLSILMAPLLFGLGYALTQL